MTTATPEANGCCMIRKFLGLLLLLPVLAAGCATPLKGRHVYSVDFWTPSNVDLRYYHLQGKSGVVTLLKGASLDAVFEHMQALPPEDAMLLVHFTKPARMRGDDLIGAEVAPAALKILPPEWLERTRFFYDHSTAHGPPWMRLDSRTGQYVEDPDFDW